MRLCGKKQPHYCISVTDLRQTYGLLNAIDGISFNVEYGKVFGFLGPNGAGKTTTIKILTSLIQPSSGTVRIFDKDILKHSIEVRKRLGVVTQQPSFEANLTGACPRSLRLYEEIASQKTERKINGIIECI